MTINDKTYNYVRHFLPTLIDEGNVYSITFKDTIGASSTAYYHFVTPDSPEIYAIDRNHQHNGSDDVDIFLFEDPTIDVQGTTEETPRNLNRNKGDNSALTIYNDTTFTDDGTQLEFTTIFPVSGGAGSARTFSSDLYLDKTERILKPNTSYVLKITNIDTGASADVLTKILWHEGI